jgi:hypothetical protein
VADQPGAIVAGFKLFWRYPGGVFQLLIDLPCWTDDGGAKACWGTSAPYAVPQRGFNIQLEDVEFAVKTYDTQGDVSDNFSNVISACMPPIYPGRPVAYQ